MRVLAVVLGTVQFVLASATSAVTFDFAFVGDVGNACDPQPDGCFWGRR
jgi:hypothetical protein